jgi:CubicO group peptidase (beta-lactamase class C family)
MWFRYGRRSVFQLASASKPVSAWGVMKLVEDDRLALDAPVQRYLTRWHLPASPFDTSGVTVRRLLSHTAGLSLPGYLGFDPGEPLPTLEASLDGMTNVSSDAAEDLGPVHLVQPPGQGWRYSGGGYTLLQLLVEEVSGRSFAAHMRDAVLQPLGMTTSSFEWDPPLEAAAATGYDTDEQSLPDYRYTELAPAGLNSTAGGLARWVAGALAGPHGEPPGRGVLAPTSLSQMFAPQPAAAAGSNAVFGLGYLLGQQPGGPLWADHFGGNRGWRTYFGARPDERAGIVVLTNSDNGIPLIVSVVRAWGESTGVGSSPALPEPE